MLFRLLIASAVASTALKLPAMLRPTSSASRGAISTIRMEETDFDLVVVGCGVGGHGAALHAVSKGLSVAVCSGGDVGGTCVNRGCVPSKALLAASGRVRDMQDTKHLAALGITAGSVSYDREKVAAHANNLASTVKKNLGNSLVGLGVTTFEEAGELVDGKTVNLVGSGKTIKAKNVILATGSVPFVPPGVETDGKTVFTSDEALKLEWARLATSFARHARPPRRPPPLCRRCPTGSQSSGRGTSGSSFRTCTPRSAPRSPSSRRCPR